MAKKRRKIPVFVIGVWVINVVGILGLGTYFLFFRDEKSTRTLPALATVEEALSSSQHAAAPAAAPTIYFLPSVTPNPRSTQIVSGATPTAFSWAVEEHESGVFVIGHSVEGRPLEVYKFGNGASERLIVAGIHGGYEWNTIALADELIAELKEHPELVPSDVSLYILRAFNPDGLARSRSYDGRANANGVDLNHNFPYRWKEEWDKEGCWDYRQITAGKRPASEPETISLINFVNLHNFDALISYHSAALGVFAGGVPPFAPSESLAFKIGNSSPYTYPPVQTGCDYSGNLADWASSVKSIPSVDIELSNHQDTDFGPNLRILGIFLNWRE